MLQFFCVCYGSESGSQCMEVRPVEQQLPLDISGTRFKAGAK